MCKKYVNLSSPQVSESQVNTHRSVFFAKLSYIILADMIQMTQERYICIEYALMINMGYFKLEDIFIGVQPRPYISACVAITYAQLVYMYVAMAMKLTMRPATG